MFSFEDRCKLARLQVEDQAMIQQQSLDRFIRNNDTRSQCNLPCTFSHDDITDRYVFALVMSRRVIDIHKSRATLDMTMIPLVTVDPERDGDSKLVHKVHKTFFSYNDDH